jgi:hypothetical protein
VLDDYECLTLEVQKRGVKESRKEPGDLSQDCSSMCCISKIHLSINRFLTSHSTEHTIQLSSFMIYSVTFRLVLRLEMKELDLKREKWRRRCLMRIEDLQMGKSETSICIALDWCHHVEREPAMPSLILEKSTRWKKSGSNSSSNTVFTCIEHKSCVTQPFQGLHGVIRVSLRAAVIRAHRNFYHDSEPITDN